MTGASRPPAMRIDELLCFLVHSTDAAFNRAYRKPLERLGLTYPQYLVMLTLWADDALSVGEIGDRLRLDSSTLTPLLKRLESLGHVSRTRSAEDERRVIVRLTAAGQMLRQEVGDVMGCVGDAVGLDAPDLAELTTRLRALRDNLDGAARLADLPAGKLGGRPTTAGRA